MPNLEKCLISAIIKAWDYITIFQGHIWEKNIIYFQRQYILALKLRESNDLLWYSVGTEENLLSLLSYSAENLAFLGEIS